MSDAMYQRERDHHGRQADREQGESAPERDDPHADGREGDLWEPEPISPPNAPPWCKEQQAAAAPQSERRVLARGWAIKRRNGTLVGQERMLDQRPPCETDHLLSDDRLVYVELVEVEAPPEGEESR